MSSFSRVDDDRPSPGSAEFILPQTHFFGRTLTEYRRLFALDEERDLKVGARVLDVAAGPASFTAEATLMGVYAVAVDPQYGARPEALELLARGDHAKVAAQMRAKPGLMRPGPESFPDLETAITERGRAAQRFLADYDDGFLHGRYVGAALPRLPFVDGAFELTLCAHLLFLHAGLLDYGFHLAACRELTRVTQPGGEVRMHPVCGGDGRLYPKLGDLRAELAGEGVASELREVRGSFFRAATATLVLCVPGK